VVEGMLEQPFQSAPLWISGNLDVGHLVTTGCLVVMGNVTVRGHFYGNCTNYCTHVFGDFSSESVVLEKNHHFAIHGEVQHQLMLDDEEDGPDATAEWMQKWGVEPHDEAGLARALRKS
jgi:hypothetical protein